MERRCRFTGWNLSMLTREFGRSFSSRTTAAFFLRMLSKENASVVELGVNENPGPYKQYTPSGSLTIRDGTGTPAIRLRTLDKGEAALSFSSTGNPEIY